MKHPRITLFTVAVIAVTGLAPATAEAAVPGRAIKPADTTPTLVRTLYTDVNGDNTRDTVELRYLGSNQFTLTATTTKGVSSSVAFTSYVDDLRAPANSTWYGASTMDAHKGSELIVNNFTAESAQGIGTTMLGVYTWRSGKLVAETAPASSVGKAWQVSGVASTLASGYNFFTRHGHRYVDVTRLVTNTVGKWRGTVTRSVWRTGAWVKLSTRTVTHRRLSAWSQIGIGGPKLLLSQVKTDVNGNGTPDLTSVYQARPISRYLVSVRTGSTTRTASYSTDGDSGFVGAATVDGVAGAELIFRTEAERPVWKLFTWRNGKLANLPGPVVAVGAKVGEWTGAGDGTVTNYTAGVEAGLHYVTQTWASELPAVHVKKWVWRTSGWTTVQDWTDRTLTPEQQAAFHRGFEAGDLVAP